THDEAVPLANVADVLQLVLVLVRPERVNVSELGPRAQHRPGRGRSLLLGVVVVLDADPAEQGMHVIGRIAGGEYSRHAGPAGGVDQYAVVHRYLCALQDSHSRPNADGYNWQPALQLAPFPRPGALHPAGTSSSHHL